jgi:hypothetical protein
MRACLVVFCLTGAAASAFEPSWSATGALGITGAGALANVTGGAFVRVGAHRQHSEDVAFSVLAEYELAGTTGAGGWASLISVTFQAHRRIFTGTFQKPPYIYALIAPVGVVDLDARPGNGAGFRAGIGLRDVSLLFVELYVQPLWTQAGSNVQGVLAVGLRL